MVIRLYNYKFTPKNRELVLKDILIVETAKIQYINNITKGIVLFNYSVDAPLTTDGTNIVTLSRSCAGMSYKDELEITYGV